MGAHRMVALLALAVIGLGPLFCAEAEHRSCLLKEAGVRTQYVSGSVIVPRVPLAGMDKGSRQALVAFLLFAGFGAAALSGDSQDRKHRRNQCPNLRLISYKEE